MAKGIMQQKVINDFSIGMNTRVAPHLLPSGASPNMINCRIDESGSVSKVFGYELLGTKQTDYSAGAKNWGLFKSGTGTEILVTNGGTTIKYYDTVTEDWINLPTLAAETFAPAAVNTGTEEITVTKNFTTGTRIKFTSTGTLPAPLVSGTSYFAINVSATKIKVASTRAFAFAGTALDLTTQGTGTHTVTGFMAIATANKRVAYQMYLDKLYMASQEFYFEWNGSTAVIDQSDFIDTTMGDLLMLDGELRAMYMSGDDDNPSTVYVTAVDSATDFAGGQTVKVYENDGSRITGMVMFLGTRYIIKGNKIVRLDYDSSTGIHTPVLVAEYGAIGKDAWTTGDNYIYVFTGSEIRAFGFFQGFSDSTRTSEFSFDIKPSILSDMNEDFIGNAKLYFHDNQIVLTYVSVDQSTEIYDKQLKLDLNLPNVSDEKGSRPPSAGFSDFPIQSMLSVDRDFYFGDGLGNLFILNDEFSANGVAIESRYETNSDILTEDVHRYKGLRYVEFEFKNITGSVRVTVEGQTNSGLLIDSATLNIGLTGFTGTWHEFAWHEAGWHGYIENSEIAFLRYRQSVKPIVAQTFKYIFESLNNNEAFTLLSIGYIFEEKEKSRYHPNFVR